MKRIESHEKINKSSPPKRKKSNLFKEKTNLPANQDPPQAFSLWQDRVSGGLAPWGHDEDSLLPSRAFPEQWTRRVWTPSPQGPRQTGSHVEKNQVSVAHDPMSHISWRRPDHNHRWLDHNHRWPDHIWMTIRGWRTYENDSNYTHVMGLINMVVE